MSISSVIPMLTQDESPEFRWLLLCLRARYSQREDARESRHELQDILQAPFAWEKMLELAEYHSIRPLIYQHFYNNAFENVPQHIHETLSTFIRHNLVSTTLLASNLPKVTELLQSRGVPSLPYKGPVLASLLYGDSALREFSDLDILIHHLDAAPSCQVLLDAGFTETYGISPSLRGSFLQTATACDFLAPSAVFRVEIHWKNSGRAVSHFPDDWFWKDSQKVAIGDVTVETIPLLTHLLLLCIHGSKHGWSRLGYLCDIAALIQKFPDQDWTEFWERARICGATRMCMLAVFLVQGLFGIVLPDGLKSPGPIPREVPALAARSILLMHEQAEPGAMYALQLQDDLFGQLRFLTRMGFTPGIREYSMMELPSGLHFLYSGLRMIRMAGMAVRGL